MGNIKIRNKILRKVRKLGVAFAKDNTKFSK